MGEDGNFYCKNGKVGGRTGKCTCSQDHTTLLAAIIAAACIILFLTIQIRKANKEKMLARKAALAAVAPSNALNDLGIQDDVLDRASMMSVANTIKNEPQNYTQEEDAAIKKGIELYEKCKEMAMLDKFDKVKSPDDKVNMKSVPIEGSLATGLATAVIDASVEESVAYEYADLYSRSFNKKSKERGITFLHVKKISDHSQYYSSTRSLGIPGFSLREARNKITWKKLNDKVMFVVSDTNDLLEEFPIGKGNVLIQSHIVWMFEKMEPIGNVPQTAVTLSAQFNLGGVFSSKSASLLTKVAAPKYLSLLSDLRQRFDKSKEIQEYKSRSSESSELTR